MKVVFLKLQDPIAWRKPDAVFFSDDLEDLAEISVHCVAGIVIHETDQTIVIGEMETSKDNLTLAKFGHSFPQFRYPMSILKKNIIKRQDFDIVEKESNHNE